MIFQDSNIQPCSPIAPNFSPTDNIEQQESRMMNIFCSYKDQYQQNLYQYENESQSPNNKQTIKTSQINSISSNISGSFPPGNSYELGKDIITTEPQSHLPNDNQQNDYLPNLNNFSNRISRVNQRMISNSIIKDKSMDDLIYEGKDSFSSRQIEQSRSDTSFLNYAFNSHQPLSNPILENCKSNQVQISHTFTPQISKNFYNKPTNLITSPAINKENDTNYDSSDDENGIPLEMALGSHTSKDLSLLSISKPTSTNEEKHVKHKSSRISLTEARLHGKNNSGEFVGKNPSLMTIVEDEEDDVEEEFEYEEDYEEDAENIILENKDDAESKITKSLEMLHNKSNEKQIISNFSTDFSFIPKNIIQPSESQHNLSIGIKRQVQTSNSTNNIALSYFVKSYAGLNSKIIDLNPTDDDFEYEYEYDENPNSPISLMEASDINEYSHQSGLNGSRTIEDLIEEQKKAAIASSSSAISAMAAAATMRGNEENDNFNIRRIFRKRSNISLSELVPKKRACFTVEDMMRLQNLHFSNKGKNAASNSGDSIIKPHKPKYSEEEMIKDQKILIKNFKNEEIITNNQDKEIDNKSDISELIPRPIESTFNEATNIVSTRSINIEGSNSNSDKDNSDNSNLEKDEMLNEETKKKLNEITNENTPNNSKISDNEQKSQPSAHQDKENEQSTNEENEKKDFLFDKDSNDKRTASNQIHQNIKSQNIEQKKTSTAKLILLLFLIPSILIFLFSLKNSK